MGMIWQEEVLKDRRKREWRMFWAGVCFAVAVMGFTIVFVVKATGSCL